MTLLGIKGLSRGYQYREKAFQTVNGVDLPIRQDDSIDIIGHPRNGKSTLLSTAAGLLMPASSSIRLNDTELYALKDREILELRNAQLGYISQGLGMLPTPTVSDNVRLPCFLSRRQGDASGQASLLLDEAGISVPADMLPSQLPGGELHRVLTARALVNEPDILITGEPTPDLDIETTREIMELFARVNKSGTTISVVTHEPDTLEFGNRVLIMASGQLTEGSHLGSL